MLHWTRLHLALLAALALVACEAAVETAEPRPLNLLLVTLDTVRADALGAYGQPRPSSPTIDRLAREGVVFEQVASSAPLTLPSHATLLTGQFPFAHGVRSNSEYALAPESHTLAEVLREHGYRTGAEIASPVLNAQRGLAQGFDHYRDLDSADIQRTQTLGGDGSGQGRSLDERPADDISRWGMRFLSEHRERPFFLWLHYFDPHLSHIVRPGYAQRMSEDPYLAEILFMDAQIGEVIRHLEELGLRERTLVVLVADHGEGRGDHGEVAHGFFVYEATMRVPFVLWGPASLPPGRRVASLVRTADVAPTILDLLGLPPLGRGPSPAGGIQGRSLVPLLSGELEDLGLVAYGESVEAALVFGSSPLRSLRSGDWKYIHQLEPLLFNVREDPGESTNRAASEPGRVARMRAQLETLLASAPAQAGATTSPLDAEEAARLRALGYLGAGRLEDERLASLELRGPPPTELAADVTRLAEAGGLLRGGQPARAEPMLRELAERHPASAMIRRDHAAALRGLGRVEEARRVLERLVETVPCEAAARVELARLLGAMNELEAQLEVMRAGVGHCSESSRLLNQLAFALATGPRAELRDGPEAVLLARRALELAGEERAMLLDTLAAAHAEAGDFTEAVRISQRALALALRRGRSPKLVAQLRRSLEHFQQGQPLRSE